MHQMNGFRKIGVKFKVRVENYEFVEKEVHATMPREDFLATMITNPAMVQIREKFKVEPLKFEEILRQATLEEFPQEPMELVMKANIVIATK